MNIIKTMSCAVILSFSVISGAAASDLASYERVFIAPVSIDLPERSNRRGGERPVSRRDQERKAADLREKLSDAFDDDFTIVAEPGDGVLTIETVITELKSTRPTPADLTREPGLSFESLFVGGAAATFTLSENGAVLDEFSDDDFGNFNDGNIRVGIWQDADRAFSLMSRRLVRYVKKN
ncbi:MAG: DUF3313 family protein [Pseudomonadota bacterium]